jgi:predicted nucleic acid-binding protein
MNCMSDKTFIDTNVLIYAHDIDAKAKHEIAKAVLRDLWRERTGILSMQVLQEFYVNVTRKIPSPLSKDSARSVVNTYSIWCMETTPAEISAAFGIEDESRIGFWDALIRFVRGKEWCDSHSFGRFERWTAHRWRAYRESLCWDALTH